MNHTKFYLLSASLAELALTLTAASCLPYARQAQRQTFGPIFGVKPEDGQGEKEAR